jgi:hypothetical protein
MVRYTEDGTAVWGDQITGETAMAEDMVKNANDELFVTGMFRLQLAFGDIILETEADFENFLTGVATGTVTSVPEGSELQDYHVYPNPADNYISINSTGNYRIFDISGRLMKSGKSDNGIVDISDLKSGYYIINIWNEDSLANLRFSKR